MDVSPVRSLVSQPVRTLGFSAKHYAELILETSGTWLLLLAILIWAFGIPRSGLGQDQGQDQIESLRDYKPSPEAASLVEVADVPVSLQTGKVQFSKTLYTIETESLELPITLSYNGRAVKAGDLPSWVGLGWSLSAGGTVSRSARGNPDEGLFDPHRPGYAEKGDDLIDQYFDGHGSQDKGNLQDPGFSIRADVNSSKHNINERDIDLRSQYDFGPDRFMYNFAGRSGRFLLGPAPDGVSSHYVENAPIYNVPRSDIEIEPKQIGSNDIDEWRITSKEGKKYIFGKKEKTKYMANGNEFPSSWYLTKITSKNTSQNIKINYKEGEYVSYYTTGSQFRVLGENYNGNKCLVQNVDQTGKTYERRAEYKTYVKSIKSNDVVVDFFSSPREGIGIGSSNFSKLDSIVVKRRSSSGVNPVLKRINFEYQYFLADTSSAPDPEYDNNSNYAEAPLESPKRLRLEKVVIEGPDGEESVPYSFDYYDTPDGSNGYDDDDVKLPSRYSTSIDHWGFPNGRSNTTLVPGPEGGDFPNGVSFDNYDFEPADRRPASSPDTLLPGILKRITYPTGGTTTFVYERNRYGWTTDQADPYNWGKIDNKVGPGLRIKRIEKNDKNSDTPKKVRRFDYTMDGSSHSSGTLATVPHRFYKDDGVWAVVGKSGVAVGHNDGTHVNYREVTVLHGPPDRSDGTPIGGKTRYEFTTSRMTLANGYRAEEESLSPGGSAEMPPGGLLPPGMQRLKSWEYGLQAAQDSRAADGTLQRRKETDHVLSNDALAATPDESVRFRRFPVLMRKVLYSNHWKRPDDGSTSCNPDKDGFAWLGWTEAATAFTAQDSMTVTRYDPGGSITLRTTTSLDYQDGEHFQLREKTKTTSNGLERTTRYKYAYEVACGGVQGVADPPCLDQTGMEDENMLSQKYRTTVTNGTGTILKRTWKTWEAVTPGTKTIWVPRREWRQTGQ